MFRFTLLLLVFLCGALTCIAQEDDTCNALGVWLWRFENTGQPSHTNLGRTIAGMGGKRIYIKVADGAYNPDSWVTLLDEELIQDYLDEGVSPWAWSYNYPGNVEAQAKALYLAAKTGYQGFVVDIEIEFNGEDVLLDDLMKAFWVERQRAIADGFADPDFKLYVTTWGNPITHNYRIDIIDQYVDGYMPQTYIEEWAGDHLTMIENCIEESKLEYESLGATKPLHNILSTAQEILSAEEITHFFELSGPQASLWRVPGGGVSTLIWDRWYNVDWEMNFCNSVSTDDQHIDLDVSIYPNPIQDILNIQSSDFDKIEGLKIYRQDGVLVKELKAIRNTIDLSALPNGMYNLMIFHRDQILRQRFVKL